jgi:hypothetical protein
MAGKLQKYTEKQIAFLREYAPGRYMAQIVPRFNKMFKLNATKASICNLMTRNEIRCGVLPKTWQKGSIPWNKGAAYCAPGSERGWFKPGKVPHTAKPVGTVRKISEGYLEIKIADGARKWRGLHLLVYESLIGHIPKGHCVIFGDGNPCNLSPDNLVLVSRAQLLVMNHCKLIYSKSELTKIGALAAKVKILAKKRKKGMLK